MPSDGEKFQWGDEIAYYGHVPKSENDDGHSDYLMKNTNRGKGQIMVCGFFHKEDDTLHRGQPPADK